MVDDDADWRELVVSWLDEWGYDARAAASGQEALDALERDGDCSVMLLDLRMPEMSGEEVVQHLPQHHPRIVFMTAANTEDVAPALSTGAHYYLPKGASREQLALMLESLEHS